MKAHLYTAVYRYIRPLPPPAPPAYRGATEGPGPPSYVGSSEERPCPDLGLCAPPSAPAGAGAAAGGWAPPPPDDCTCRVKPRLKSPPPPPLGRQTGCHTSALRGAPLTVCPTRCPAPPSRTAALLRPCCPPTKGGGGGCVVPGGGGGTTLSPTLALSLPPLTQSSNLWLPLCLHPRLPCSTLLPQNLPCSILLPHTLPCSTLLPQTLPCSIHLPQTLPCSTLLPQTLSCSILLLLVTEGWGGTLTLPIPKPPCSSLLLAILGWNNSRSGVNNSRRYGIIHRGG